MKTKILLITITLFSSYWGYEIYKDPKNIYRLLDLLPLNIDHSNDLSYMDIDEEICKGITYGSTPIIDEPIALRVRDIVVMQAGVDISEIYLDSFFHCQLGMNTLDLVEFAMVIEDEFNIEIPDVLAETMLTVEKTVNVINKLQKSKD